MQQSLPLRLSTCPSFRHNAFHLTISDFHKTLTILCVHPETIIDPAHYHSFLATECVIDAEKLGSSALPVENLTVIGILGDDYFTIPAVWKAICKVLAAQNGYETIYNALKLISDQCGSHLKEIFVVIVSRR